MAARPQRFPVGTEFIPAGRQHVYKVIDFLTTSNLAGEVVKTEYLWVHGLFPDTTIARATILPNSGERKTEKTT